MQLLLDAHCCRGLLSVNLSAALHAGRRLYDDVPKQLLTGQAMTPGCLLQGT